MKVTQKTCQNKLKTVTEIFWKKIKFQKECERNRKPSKQTISTIF